MWFGHDPDKLIEAIVLSSKVPVFAGDCRIDQWITLDTKVDVLRECVSIPVGVDYCTLGSWSVGFTRWKRFEFVRLDEAGALAWLRENGGIGAEPARRKPGPPSKLDQPNRLTNKQLAAKYNVDPRTITRWRAAGNDVS
jgi:hypothetical protein